MAHDDETLARRAGGGDAEAFRRLVDRHYDACLRYATRMLHDGFAAEDAVQETFVRAYRALPSYTDRGRFRSWLFSILVNRCRTEGRRRSVRKEVFVEEEAAEGVAVDGGGGDPSDVRPFRRRDLTRALGLLTEDQREAFLLKFVEEWTYPEMAELTGAGVPALKMRVARARETLRKHLRHGEDE